MITMALTSCPYASFFAPLVLSISPRYLTEGKQAVFTETQQQDGIATLPFIVAGLFAFTDQPCPPPIPPAPPASTRARECAELGLNDVNKNDNNADGDEADYEADDEADVLNVGRGFRFDWAAYHAVWHDTPYSRAVTALFAKYASLYSCISGQVRSSVPPPMTWSRGLSIAEQASRSVTLYVNPVVGAIYSTKIHKLLCHIMSATRWHGDLQNGTTAGNESQHKTTNHFTLVPTNT